MTLYTKKPIISILEAEIKPSSKEAFAAWQAKLNGQIVNFPGFVSLEFSSPTEQRKGWAIVQRFSETEAASAWHQSTQYGELYKELKILTLDNKIKEKSSDEEIGNVTEVIVTEVQAGKEEAYRAWSAKIHQVEALFPGFRGVYVQSPVESKGKHWITLLQFDTMENLDKWLQSSERQQILDESSSLISSLETHRVISPYAGWFASIAKQGEMPPLWKQTMLVLLVLFPIVMLELKFLSPLTAGFDMSLGMFIGNAISVSLISFPMMPLAIWFLGWWLSTGNWKVTLYGTCIVILLYLIEIAIFWNF